MALSCMILCILLTRFLPPATLCTYLTRLFYFSYLLIQKSHCKPLKDQHKKIIEFAEGEFLLMHSTQTRPLVEIICWSIRRLLSKPTRRNLLCRSVYPMRDMTCSLPSLSLTSHSGSNSLSEYTQIYPLWDVICCLPSLSHSSDSKYTCWALYRHHPWLAGAATELSTGTTHD